MNATVAGLAGLIFGLGLLLAGMADPSKVLGFLDVAGNWDPSLAFVMGGAIATAAPAFAWARRRKQAWLGQPMQLPPKGPITGRLVLGSIAFGVGWGLAGICPGPGLVLLGRGAEPGMLFVAAMLAGMGAFAAWERWHSRPAAGPSAASTGRDQAA